MKNLSKKELKTITIFFLLSRLVLVFFLFYYHNFSSFNLYDVKNYIEIAKSGYSKELLYAFFPLWPILIRLFHIIIPSYSLVVLLLSNLFSYFSAIIFYLIIHQKKDNQKKILFFLFSPILVFTMIGYTESLYLFLTLLSFYLYKKEKYWFCGIILGLSMLTRNTGIILLGAIGLEMLYHLYQKKITIKSILSLAMPAIIIGFSYNIFLYIQTGDFFKYISVQYTEWNKEHCNMITLLFKDIHFLIKFHQTDSYLFLLNWSFIFLSLFYSIKNIKKEQAQSIYVIVSVLLFCMTCRNSTSTWMSLPSAGIFRYIYSLFPMYTLSHLKRKKYSFLLDTLYLSISMINVIVVLKYHIFIA